MRIGLLAIHGDVIEHERALRKAGATVVPVRLPEDLRGLHGIVLPGGESTTLSLLLRRFKLLTPLRAALRNGLPAWGTCAGAILLAKKVTGKNPPPTLAVMDIVADRNAYGSQIDSFTAPLRVALPQPFRLRAVFIRAPQLRPLRADVKVLARHAGKAVLMQQANLLASSFHPELTTNIALQRYFLTLCRAYGQHHPAAV